MTVRRLGFYMPRANYLKAMGPVIDHVVRERSHDYRPVVLLPGWPTSKAQLRPEVTTFPSAWAEGVDVRVLSKPGAFIDLVRGGAIDALFSVQPAISDLSIEDVDRLRAESLAKGVKWVALPDGFSQNGYVVTQAASLLANWDLVCTLGPHSMRYIEKHLLSLAPDMAAALRARIAVVGYPEFDGLAQMAEPAAIRRKYGLPADKKIIVLATAARTVPLSVNTWTARGLDARFRGDPLPSASGLVARLVSLRYPHVLSYRRHLEAVRRFADANDAVVVAKTRSKHRDAAYVSEAVDYFFDDQSYFPFTTLELLRVASLYVGFYSNTVSEAVACGVRALTFLHAPPREMQQDARWREFGKAMSWGPEGLWQVPGVSDTIAGTTAAGAAALVRFEQAHLDDYSMDAAGWRRAASDFFNYPCDSSALVIEALEARWH